MYHRTPHEKVFTINAAAPETLSSVIGRFPVVVLSPENSTITSGGPAERRKFLDLILSQVSHAYFEDLMEYRRVLKQRNKILSEWRQLGAQRYEMLEPWDVNLVRYGSRIAQRRQNFVGEITQYVKNAYAQLVDVDEGPNLQYGSNVRGISPNATVDEIAAMMHAGIERHRHEEFRRGVSLVGPHRDDVGLVLGEKPVKEYASQGQHKTFLVALKLAEFFYIRERKQEWPIFLLDDVFSELDASRTERILRQLSGLGQTILTTTDEMVFRDAVGWSESSRRFYVENGACRAA
jgi:DNA replication and repair protein RecF